jgi:hypothetical protein
MATDIRLKKSSVAGRIPDSSDLEYGELAINYADEKLYFKNSSNVIKSIGGSGIDSATITSIVDSDYVLSRGGASFPVLDSAGNTALNQKITFVTTTSGNGTVVLNSQLTLQDSAGDDTTIDLPFSAGGFSDSAAVTNLIDAAYIQARQQLVDSASIIALVDSDYVRTRQNNYLDSALATQLIDSAYVQIRVPETYLATIIDSDYIADRQAAGTDSSTVITLVESTVDSAYVAARSSGAAVTGSVNTHYADSFVGDGSTSSFIITNPPSTDAELLITLNGVVQHTDTYSFSGSTVTLDSAPETGDQIEIRSNKVTTTNVTLRDYQNYFFTPDSATSTFSGLDNRGTSLSYTRGKVEVYLNGTKLVDSDDYTAVDGSTIDVLGDPVDSGDTLEIISLAAAAIYSENIFTTSKDFDSAGSDQFVEQWNKNDYRTVKYLISIEHDSDNKYHSEEILLSHNGTKVGMTTYAQVLLDSNLGTFDADIVSDKVRLLFSPTYSNTSIKLKALRTGA